MAGVRRLLGANRVMAQEEMASATGTLPGRSLQDGPSLVDPRSGTVIDAHPGRLPMGKGARLSP
jgi:hypothetical protein